MLNLMIKRDCSSQGNERVNANDTFQSSHDLFWQRQIVFGHLTFRYLFLRSLVLTSRANNLTKTNLQFKRYCALHYAWVIELISPLRCRQLGCRQGLFPSYPINKEPTFVSNFRASFRSHRGWQPWTKEWKPLTVAGISLEPHRRRLHKLVSLLLV